MFGKTVLQKAALILIASTIWAGAHARDALVLGSSVLNGSSSVEAQRATADGFNVTVVDDATWTAMTAAQFAHYDLGQAIAHLTFQARALGLFVRQFRAFDRDAVAAEFDVPDHWEVTTMAAIGRLPEGVEPASHRAAHDRRPLVALVHVPERPGGRDRAASATGPSNN